ncbi:MAG: hypothetical protein M1812_006082 [Candelaria pacifica]|nr:MAG: hypothetical protein M1812_006082 [Candelaria pacifica]
MSLELHIWGPAFCLPSIDAQCIAATAYLSQAVPRENWKLVASSDPTLSPASVSTDELPALRDGSTWVGGFGNIVQYLKRYSDGKWDLDAELDPEQRADCIAFASHIVANGQPLLDLSLYVSTENYTSVTRSTYTALLPWPTQYIVPSSHRAAAKARSAHLGLSALDIDSADEAKPADKSADGSSQIPASLRVKRPQTLMSLLRQPQHASQIRLHTLTKTFLDPLQDLLGEKRFFFSDHQPSSLDCLALGYLSLAIYPDLPQAWLARTMREKFGRLCAYVETLRHSSFGGDVRVKDALLSRPNETLVSEKQEPKDQEDRQEIGLPWVAPKPANIVSISSFLLKNMADSLPISKDLRAASRLRHYPSTDPLIADLNQPLDALANSERPSRATQLLTVAAAVSVTFVGLVYTGFVTLPSLSGKEEESRKGGLEGMGEAGESLKALAAMMDWEARNEPSRVDGGMGSGEPVAEVDVEVRDRVAV